MKSNVRKWRMSCCKIFCRPLEGSEANFKVSTDRATCGEVPDRRNVQILWCISQGYYRYLQYKNIPAKDAPLANMIAECQSVRGKIHGYRYIQLWLEKIKYVYRNPKTVLRVMRKYGLLSEVRRKRWKGCGQSIHRYANILNRSFHAERPNEKWVTDISYIPTAQGFLYLSVIRGSVKKTVLMPNIEKT